jgi:hypothetical protein
MKIQVIVFWVAKPKKVKMDVSYQPLHGVTTQKTAT